MKTTIYKLGNHKLMHGDSTNAEHVRELIGDEKIKMLFSSPPYNLGNSGLRPYKNKNDNMKTSAEYIDFNLKVIHNYRKYLQGFLFWNLSYNANSSTDFIDIFYNIIHGTDLQFLDLIVWDKTNGMPITGKRNLTRTCEEILFMGDKLIIQHELKFLPIMASDETVIYNTKTKSKFTNLWKCRTTGANFKNHKACFPVELPETAMKLMTLENETVCDCFNGAGSTLIAAEKMNRKYLGMELDEDYIKLTIERWEEFTGKKAEVLS